LTGLAQIQNIDMSNPPRLAEVDANYLATRTFAGDISIIFQTVFGGNRGASRG
jgi:O-antigen biosynthesis protein WbqP